MEWKEFAVVAGALALIVAVLWYFFAEAFGGDRALSLRAAKLVAVMAVLGLFGAGAGLAFAYSGAYNVGATDGHSAPVELVLRTTMERSVRAHARSVTVPEGYDMLDPELAAKAIGHYSVACALCHSAPGSSRAPWMVIYPEPADLTRREVVARWSDAELYWIIKHGIKDTGMLALGPTHKEEDLWAVTAFVRQLPDMTVEDYNAQVAAYHAQRTEAMGGAGREDGAPAEPLASGPPADGEARRPVRKRSQRDAPKVAPPRPAVKRAPQAEATGNHASHAGH